ncbi:MAG: hypothetical protein PHJ00_03190, partial [Candidatus Omnitrophica bacterium]|nr:hypothetical protein [Candidatus Omnitrophota bacterium]
EIIFVDKLGVHKGADIHINPVEAVKDAWVEDAFFRPVIVRMGGAARLDLSVWTNLKLEYELVNKDTGISSRKVFDIPSYIKEFENKEDEKERCWIAASELLKGRYGTTFNLAKIEELARYYQDSLEWDARDHKSSIHAYNFTESEYLKDIHGEAKEKLQELLTAAYDLEGLFRLGRRHIQETLRGYLIYSPIDAQGNWRWGPFDRIVEEINQKDGTVEKEIPGLKKLEFVGVWGGCLRFKAQMEFPEPGLYEYNPGVFFMPLFEPNQWKEDIMRDEWDSEGYLWAVASGDMMICYGKKEVKHEYIGAIAENGRIKAVSLSGLSEKEVQKWIIRINKFLPELAEALSDDISAIASYFSNQPESKWLKFVEKLTFENVKEEVERLKQAIGLGRGDPARTADGLPLSKEEAVELQNKIAGRYSLDLTAALTDDELIHKLNIQGTLREQALRFTLKYIVRANLLAGPPIHLDNNRLILGSNFKFNGKQHIYISEIVINNSAELSRTINHEIGASLGLMHWLNRRLENLGVSSILKFRTGALRNNYPLKRYSGNGAARNRPTRVKRTGKEEVPSDLITLIRGINRNNVPSSVKEKILREFVLLALRGYKIAALLSLYTETFRDMSEDAKEDEAVKARAKRILCFINGFCEAGHISTKDIDMLYGRAINNLNKLPDNLRMIEGLNPSKAETLLRDNLTSALVILQKNFGLLDKDGMTEALYRIRSIATFTKWKHFLKLIDHYSPADSYYDFDIWYMAKAGKLKYIAVLTHEVMHNVF